VALWAQIDPAALPRGHAKLDLFRIAYEAFLGAFGCPILTMGLESAELSKISVNMCLVASVSVANVMAELCEKAGADWREVAPALRLDKRIGPHAYLNPGLGISGGNLERDLVTVVRLAEAYGGNAGVARAWAADSRRRRDWAFATLHRMVLAAKPDAVIAVLGLAYKPDTVSTKNSPALALLRKLWRNPVTVYDPVVPATAVGRNVRAAAAPLEAARGADALVIMTPWPEFKSLVPAELKACMTGRTIIDPYRVLDPQMVAAAGIDYAALGMAPLTGGEPGLGAHA